jgi:hypothetical protein
VEEIAAQINRLSKDPDGLKIADQLKLKYWTDATFLDNFIEERAWRYLESLPKRIQVFPVEMSAKAAFNLLCGRAILNTAPLRRGEETGTWIRLDLSHKDEDGNYPVKNINGFSIDDLENCLDLLPVDNMSYYSNRNALQQGNVILVPIKDGRKVFLRANPEQRTIDIFTPDMRPIPVNLRLDPDWKPSVFQKEIISEIKHKTLPETKQNIFSKQSKKHHRRGRRM